VLGGSSKAGKSWLLLYLALCVASGRKFFRRLTKPGRVLYVNWEILPCFMATRVQVIVNHCKLESPTNLDTLNLRGITANLDTVVQQIIELAEQGNYCMIIIDPICKLMGGRSENAAGGVGALCQQLERVAERTGAAVVYAHHFTKGKQTQKKAIDRLSGSGVYGRDADWKYPGAWRSPIPPNQMPGNERHRANVRRTLPSGTGRSRGKEAVWLPGIIRRR